MRPGKKKAGKKGGLLYATLGCRKRKFTKKIEYLGGNRGGSLAVSFSFGSFNVDMDPIGKKSGNCKMLVFADEGGKSYFGPPSWGRTEHCGRAKLNRRDVRHHSQCIWKRQSGPAKPHPRR